MGNIIIPILSGLAGLLKANRGAIAKKAGTTPDIVGKVTTAFEQYLSKDERVLAIAAEELNKARQHDIETQVKGIPLVNLARGLVRPVITFTAFAWYVYARVYHIPLTSEDYAIIGGILAFWFGFRPFEKIKK